MKALLIIRVAYNGKGYHGYQRQPGLNTVEQSIFHTLRNIGCSSRVPPEFYSYSGRTDRGVHALYQTIAFLSDDRVCNVGKLASELMEETRETVLVWAYRWENELLFNARYWALWREYAYVDYRKHYECDNFRENLEEARRVTRQLSQGFLYKGVKRFPKHYLERRVLNIHVHLNDGGDTVVWRVVGESFPHNYVRRLIHVLRTRPCGKNLIEHAVSTIAGLAEPEKLFLTRVQYPIGLKKNLSGDRLLEIMETTLFKRESSDLRAVISSYESERPF